MAGKIYTPVTLWEDFSPEGFFVEVIKTLIYSDYALEKVRISRPSVSGGVSVYLEILRPTLDSDKRPLIFVCQSVGNKIPREEMKKIYDLGYSVCAIDFAGEPIEDASAFEEREYTFYPPLLSYAEYKNAKANLLAIGQTVKTSPYYEWIVSSKYALKYLRSVGYDDISVVSEKDSTIIGFTLASTEKLSCFISLFGTGWQVPIGHKFSDDIRTDFTPEEFCILAGLEAQSYASSVACPTLMLVATNYEKCDFDRAYETFSRTSENIYSAINYSISSRTLSNSSYNNFVTFLRAFAKKELIILPSETFIESKIVDGKISVTVTADARALEKTVIYASEGELDPKKRTYRHIATFKAKEDGKFTLTYQPTKNKKLVCFFAKSYYENGFSVSSQVVCKRYTDKEVSGMPEYNVIFSAKDALHSRVFEEIAPSVSTLFNMNEEPVTVKNLVVGAKNVKGLKVVGGIETNAVLSPENGAILLLDVCSDGEREIVVELVNNDNKSYRAITKIAGGNLWYNLKFEMPKFKTDELYQLKTYEDIRKIKIYSADGEFLINNLMWI
ncbi:MAG: hypothetical protein J6V68_01410 [Clostridia bacterium]|nr:hypothetical protein [Clostridia bacterium]